MRQVLLSSSGQVEAAEVPIPGPLNKSVLVKNDYSLISKGTESSAVTLKSGWKGLYEKFKSSNEYSKKVWNLVQSQGIKQTYSVIRKKLDDYNAVGYSCAGTVIETSDSDMPFQPGQKVACMGVGFACHAEYVVVPQNLVAPIPDNVSVKEASFAAISCIALQGIRRLDLSPGEYIGVIGLGLIGQVCIRALYSMGYEAIGIDISDFCVETAKQNNTFVWNSTLCSSIEKTLQITNGKGLDGVIICAGTSTSEPIDMAFDLCRKGGIVSIVGSVGLSLKREKMYKKELEVRMSCSYGPGRYDPNYEIKGNDYPYEHVRWTEKRNLEYFLGLLSRKTLDISPLVSAVYPVEEAGEAYKKVKEKNVFGVLFSYTENEKTFDYINEKKLLDEKRVIKRKTIKSNLINIGLIGAGGYAKGVHIPNLNKLKNTFCVRGIASRSGASATIAARKLNVATVTSDYRYLLDDKNIDAVLISTRHSNHAKIVLESLDSGKHVYVEKPMAINLEDCIAIYQKQKQTNLIVRVGFNRRFSSYTEAMKNFAGNGLKMITCRTNIGSITNDWSNSAEEGGRFLGECVHFFDLCNWIMEQPPACISAFVAGKNEKVNPNVATNILYPDGSVAQITYTSIGNPSMRKEFYEIFANNRCVQNDNFSNIKFFGGNGYKTTKGDKGQLKALEEFASAILDKSICIRGADAKDGLIATWMALSCYESACTQKQIVFPGENLKDYVC